MKHLILIIAVFTAWSIQAELPKAIKSKADMATVYLYGAELTHNEYINLVAGTNEVVLEGISPMADEASISAYFKGALVIDTRKEVKYPESPKTMEVDARYNTYIHDIEDSLQWLAFDQKDVSNKKEALAKEKYLLLNNRLMRGEYLKDSIPLLKASLDLMHTRLLTIDEELLALEKREYKYSKLQAKLEERLNYYQLLVDQNANGLLDVTQQYKAINQIIVTIEAEAAVSGNLAVKYYVSSAGWLPKYDVNAGSSREKLELIYRAQVYQNTGIDWSNVALTLSTSNPSQGNTKPLLSTWNLFYGYPNSYSYYQNTDKKKMQNYNIIQRPSVQTKDVANESQTDDFSEAPEPVFTVAENMLRAEYIIKTKYSIAADNKAHNVIINKEEVPVTYTFMAVPKMDNSAFLMGKITNWEDLNLLPATARIYFDDSYIGMTTVDPNTVRDTMYLDLGRDKSITIKRQNLKDKCKEQIIGDDKIVTKTIEITVRNTKTMDIAFELEDQIPITYDNTIRIELVKSDGASLNDLTGKLTWKMKLKPKETKKIVFSFEVKYPKDKVIGTL